MDRLWALQILGGQQGAAAAVDIEANSIYRWPSQGDLPATVRDRVVAAIVRIEMARAMGLTLAEFHTDKQAQASMEYALRHAHLGLVHLAQCAAQHYGLACHSGDALLFNPAPQPRAASIAA